MFVDNLFIGIPAGALVCFLFLFFCFLNLSKSKLVNAFRLVLLSCIVWTGGAWLMRMQARPGGNFWFQVSFLGLLFLPLCMYFFLFRVLDIHRNTILYVCMVCSGIIAIINATTGRIILMPQRVMEDGHGIGYTYILSKGIVVLFLLELFLLVFVTVLAHNKIGTEIAMRTELFPLLLGTCFVFAGQILEMLPNNIVPFGSMGGVLMALCFVYTLYRQSLFDISSQLLTGCAYTIAVILTTLPMWIMANDIRAIQRLFALDTGRTVFLVLALLSLWALLIIGLTWRIVEGISNRKKNEQFQHLHEFQQETASLFNEEELYKKIIKVIQSILEVHVLIFVKKEGKKNFVLVPTCEADYGIDAGEQTGINELYLSSGERRPEFATLQYNEELMGFIYLKFPKKVKMNYLEVEYFLQVASYASICLKNISMYQEVYHKSIHDELTGLYNRTYYKEFIEKYWMPHARQSLVYLDVDDFKLFNELYGEETGDAVLQWCGKVLLETVGAKGATFRAGSNEFLIYSRYRGRDELYKLVQEVQENLCREDVDRPKVLQPITVSVGMAFFPDTASDSVQLLKQAERATLFAKWDGKNCIRIFDALEMEEETENVQGYEQITPTIYALTAAIDAKDSYTFEHSIHVSEYAVLLAKKLGLGNNEIQIVKEAGLLHDIGKIGIPESILKKQGRLTDEEYTVMKTHVTNSISMIHYLPNMNYVIPAVVSHHERYDGKGYPKGLAGENIPLLGRILTVCDCYDAMVSKRPYKDKLTVEYAVSELERNKGTQFDPELADAFISLIQEGKIS